MWYDDARKLFRYRVSKLLIGDSLVCQVTGWRVDCLEDMSRPGERQFVMSCHGEELARRKRPESAVDYLIMKDAPLTLEYVCEGAKHLLSSNESNHGDLIGFLPRVDVTIERSQRHVFSNFFANTRKGDSLRFVIQQNQASWFST